MKKASIIIATMTLSATAVYAFAPQKITDLSLKSKAEREFFAGAKPLKAPAEGDLKVDFTIKGNSEGTVCFQENFDGASIPAGWTVSPTSNVTWAVKRIATEGTKSFTQYDPEDVASLYVDGPYQVFKREISSATSPAFEVGANAVFKCWVGFSRNFDDECRMSISISDNGFTTDGVELWNSGNDTGERPWSWREVCVDLADWAGKNVQIRFTYGPGGKDTFNTGGYMGDFAIDGITVSAASSIDSVDLTTGEKLELTALADFEIASWSWSFPGATPSSSTEAQPTLYYTADGDYDISLTVTDGEGKTASVTKSSFAHVTGVAPTAKIGLPATFRLTSTRLPLIAPLGTVRFHDASEGFPTEQTWTFTGIDPDNGTGVTTLSGPEADVQYAFLHKQAVGLEVSNDHGNSTALEEISVEYSGTVTNFRLSDVATVFNLDGRGEFPGTNTMGITAYAEKFSKPSRPVIVTGAYVYFTKVVAEELSDQIADVGVHLYTSENGLPGKRIDSMWWRVFELDQPQGTQLVGTGFEFTDKPVIDDEFFIVVDGIPVKNETCTVSFAMADFRAEGNTAYMLKNGVWTNVADYFPAGRNHTSFLIQPEVIHSVMSRLPIGADPEITFGPLGGTLEYEFFSYMGYSLPAEGGDGWAEIVNEPNGLTVDTLKIKAEPMPAGLEERRTELTLSDGAGTYTIPVRQSATTGIEVVKPAADDSEAVYYNLQGIRIDRPSTPGLYIRKTGENTVKVIL